jgi:hypothetical protein
MACSIDVFPDSLIPIIGINEYLKDIKVMPDTYVGKLNTAVKLENKSVLRTEIENKLKQVFDPRGIFQ